MQNIVISMIIPAYVFVNKGIITSLLVDELNRCSIAFKPATM
jgi:hypothetical protein